MGPRQNEALPMLGFASSYDSPAAVIDDPTGPGNVKTDHTPGCRILGVCPSRSQKPRKRPRDSETPHKHTHRPSKYGRPDIAKNHTICIQTSKSTSARDSNWGYVVMGEAGHRHGGIEIGYREPAGAHHLGSSWWQPRVGSGFRAPAGIYIRIFGRISRWRAAILPDCNIRRLFRCIPARLL